MVFFAHAQAMAKWEIKSADGNKKIDSQVMDNIQLHLAGLNFPENDYELAQFEKQTLVKITTAIRAYSYYQATVVLNNFNKKSFDNDGVQILLTLGAKLIVSEVVLEYDRSAAQQAHFPSELKDIITLLKAFEGKPLEQSKYDGLKSRIQSFSLIFGYFDFVLDKSEVQVSLAKNEASIYWKFNFGSRYRFGNLEYIGENRGMELVEAVKPFSESEYFDQQKVSEFTQRIRQTSYYDNVIVRANVNAMSSEQRVGKIVPIEVLLTAKPKDTYQFGIGASTDSGPRVTVNWKRPWVNLRGHSLSSELYISGPKKNVAVGYTIPMANPLNDFFKVQMGYQEVNEEQRDSQTYTLAAQRQLGAKNKNDWDKIIFLRYEYENFIQGIDEEQSTQLLLPGFTFNRVRKDGELFVNWGDRQQLTVEAASDRVISDLNVLRITARTKWIRSFGKHRYIVRGDAGAIVTNDFEQVPSSLRFFVGGDQSVRGFGLNKVSEERIDETTGLDELVGAQFLAVVSVEYAYQVSNDWRVAIFVDTGSANNEIGKSPIYGTGLGVHWLSPIGTIRLYFARGFSDKENTKRLHFSIGPGI
ncbi:outer membrane protein [Glaciecola pallidula DSM 14239 = ACAM 615]|uniref:Outer membrane protein n=2 Tax=Brumicola TaxID=3160924 RepID=K6ZC64_9ALTE|nr:outer membrane protein [Glaciecola pallidula DSM 14239 = ACAM 615]